MPFASLLILLCLAVTFDGHASSGELAFSDGVLQLYLHDGRVLMEEDLVGARFRLPDGEKVVEVELHSIQKLRAGRERTISFFRVLARHGDQGYNEVCDPDAYGRRLAFLKATHGALSMTCSSGAEGKCMLLGYLPWIKDPKIPMSALFDTCVKVIRADYGGDGRSFTRDGTVVDIYDRYGVQQPDEKEIPFEAVWGIAGALCIAKPRITELSSLQQLGERYPELQVSLGPSRCSMAAFRADSRALLFSRSRKASTSGTE